MKLSVVLSTYNGAQYLEEQLDSLREQSRCPDEVIISDDCSNDGTVPIIKAYLEKYKLPGWRLIENDRNNGWKINFARTLQMAEGDLIFPCDQDDIWHLDKLEKMSEIMEKQPEILLLASNFTPFYDENGQHMHLSPEVKKNDGCVYAGNFEKDFFYIHRPGCVYCFRRILLHYFSEYSSAVYPHDAFLWRTAFLLDGFYFYRYSTIDYRRHSGNATGRGRKNLEQKLSVMEYYKESLESAERFLDQEDVKKREQKKEIVKRYQKWCERRITFLQDGRVRSWLRLIKYRKYYYSGKAYLADLEMSLWKNRG